MNWIPILIGLGIIAIVIWAVIKVVQSLGVPIPPFVWIIAAAIIGIVLLVWLGDMLPHILHMGG